MRLSHKFVWFVLSFLIMPKPVLKRLLMGMKKGAELVRPLVFISLCEWLLCLRYQHLYHLLCAVGQYVLTDVDAAL